MTEITQTESPILVIGAGVIGLTAALVLAQAGFQHIQVIGQHMPGDHDIDYTSQWAGADWTPFAEQGSIEADWEVVTLHRLQELARTQPGAGVAIEGIPITYPKRHMAHHYRQNYILLEFRQTTERLEALFKDIVTDYRILSKEDVPDWVDWGVYYQSVSLDPSIYLHWLQSNCLELGVKFRRDTLSHIREAFVISATQPAVVVNCTGLQAASLGGVNDQKLRSVLGQMVVVANEADGIYTLDGTDDTMDSSIGECCYVIPRPAGGGTALGGSRWDGSRCTEPNLALSRRIMQRAIKLAPSLVAQGAGVETLRVVRHQVGWRPVREGGPRVEGDEIQDPELGTLKVVHAYGLGGFGFQVSYGVAARVVELVKSSLSVQWST
ncbi:putative FAD dependent oxidoreductase domain-containing protein [Seiridium cardinale]